MFAQILQNYQIYLPFIVIIMLILGIIAMFMLFKTSRKIVRQSVERKALERPYPLPNLSQHLSHAHNRVSTLLHKIKDYFEKNSNDQDKTIMRSIKKVCRMMGRLYGVDQGQYQIPWYLMLSPNDCDCKFILNSIESKLFLNPSEQADIATHDQAFNWFFYDQGVVIDYQHIALSHGKIDHQHDGQWLKFLEYIEYNRPKRPLDALIVALPVDYIYNYSTFDHEDITAYARTVNKKLTQIQHKLGMRLPIYVILTECEKITSFKDFVAALPQSSHDEIFGWSSPYAIDTNFTSSWVDDMFLSIRDALDKTRMAIFAESGAVPYQDSNVAFSTQISSLKNNLNTYLTTIFDRQRHHEPHFLRGIYFTSQISAHQLALSERGTLPDLSAPSLTMASEPHNNSKCTVFIKDLFKKKIFAESNLGQPIFNVLISTSKRLNYLKLLCGITSIIWLVGLMCQFQILRSNNSTIMPALQTVDHALQGLAAYKEHNQQNLVKQDNSVQRLKYLDDQSATILEKFAAINNSDTFALSMPSSWFNQVDQHVKMAFTAAFNSIILPALSTHLTKRGHDLMSDNHAFGYINPHQNTLNPQDSSTFKILQSYVKNVMEFEDATDLFNKVSAQKNVQDLGKIFKYIYGNNLSIQFYDHARYYETAYQQSQSYPIDVHQYQAGAGQKLETLFRKFLFMAFNIRQNYSALTNLTKHLDDLVRQKTKLDADDNNLHNINQEAILVADMISNEQFSWIESPIFNPSSEYQQLINLISNGRIFDQKIVSELLQVTHQDYIKFKLDLMDSKSTVTGPFFSIKDDQLAATPSDGLIDFIDALSLFLTEPFMAKFDSDVLIKKIPKGKLLFWDHAVLEETGQLFDNFDQYMRTKINHVSLKLQPLFKAIARSHLHNKVIANLGRAQLLQIPIVDQLNLSYTETLRAQVENLATATPLFTKILESLDQGIFGFDLIAVRKILIDQTNEILSKIDGLLDADNLYGARTSEFNKWQGTPQLAFKAFGVNDVHQMKNYLNAQRYQIQFLSKELAEPVLTLLGLGFFESAPVQIPLVLKWSRIAAVLQDYDKQSPSNSLKILEQFLLYDFNNITFDNCHMDVIEWDDLAGGDDYFLNILNRYRDKILGRCRSVNSQKINVHYQKLSQYFNDHLAGRFPFSHQLDGNLDLEATVTDVAAFLQLFDDFIKHHQQSINSNLNPAARQFIDDIWRLRPLMTAICQKSGLNFDIAFRCMQDNEIDGDKIIDWFMDVDNRRTTIRSDNKQTFWQIGDAISLYLRWAADGDKKPVSDLEQAQLRVNGNDAIFNYRGAWALLHLLRSQYSSKNRLEPSAMVQAPILQFDIPTINRAIIMTAEKSCAKSASTITTARVFMRLRINLADGTIVSSQQAYDDMTPQSLTILPDFPVRAPVLQAADHNYQPRRLYTPTRPRKSKNYQQLSGTTCHENNHH